jgi:large subunit ribosomal protein L4e
MHRAVMSHGDLARIINSNEVQSVVRAAKKDEVLHVKNKKNPLKNANLMAKLNPNDALRKK